MAAHEFQLVGGHVVLDFVNSVHDWTAAEPREYLPTYAEALRFAVATGVLAAAESRRLAGTRSIRELQQLHALRARLERMLRALVAGAPPRRDDLVALVRDAADSARAVRLRDRGGRLERSIDPAHAGIRTLRWRLVDAAVALMTSGLLEQLKSCPSCGWFFLDTSKNRSRRWCSMSACGSHAKSRRFYWRSKRRRTQTQGASAPSH